jgi:hypothetical protein
VQRAPSLLSMVALMSHPATSFFANMHVDGLVIQHFAVIAGE